MSTSIPFRPIGGPHAIAGDGHAVEEKPSTTRARTDSSDKQYAEEAAQYVTITFSDKGDAQVQFKIKRTTRLGRAMTAFCYHTKCDMPRFIFAGAHVTFDDTPEKLEMIDGDIVEVYYEIRGS
ncbi:unnamed protein product [Zymoseptoria tritici ST99CH_1E4]|uniref:Rad60/SUMO-like domain-containing protein n=1 Tax=Zymoseptoria tritici ST99CH_1E4 TaxID=1276532 RepID=A0A2H1G4M5_ZYMTR|nr:unnamed protein product [Zymoseptoria tritici ST99CH_1E4]